MRGAGPAALGVVGALMLALTSVAGSAGSSAVVEPTLQRYLERADEPLRTYRAVRHLEAHNPKFNMHGSMQALTELSEDGRFTFEILREEGSEYIRRKVLRSLLENEQKLFATSNPAKSALTPANYELAAGDLAEAGLVKLLAKPRRREVALFDGALFVTQDEADLVRIEGRLAKNPSFWTKRVDLVRHYERIGGLRVPVRLETTAQIRLAGTSTMTVLYDYAMVNGVPISSASAAAGGADTSR
jgi:hypothetical protein